MGRPLPQEIVIEILRLHHSGLNHTQIAAQLEIGAGTAYNVLWRHGIRVSYPGRAVVVHDPRDDYRPGAEFSVKDVYAGMALVGEDGCGAWHNGMQFAVRPRWGEPYIATVVGRTLIRHDTRERLEARECGTGTWVPQ